MCFAGSTVHISCFLSAIRFKGVYFVESPAPHASIIEKSRSFSGQCYSKKPEP